MTFRPLTHRAFQWCADTLSVPPVVIGIVISLALGALALWISWLIGVVADVEAGRAPDIALRAPVTLYMILGYLPMALYYLSVWTTRHWETIARQFGIELEPIRFPRLAANILGAVGAIAMYALFLHRTDRPFLVFQPANWPSDFTFPLVGLLLMGWFYSRFAFLLIWNGMEISRTARRIRSLDLLDVSLVKPYAQQGVRSSLLVIVSLSILANLWLDPASPTIGTVTTLVTLVAAAILSLILPTWGIRQRVRATKEHELKQIRDAIAARRDPRARSVEDAHQLRADLAVEQRLMDVNEWPFDGGSYGRVALYVMLGLGSWVGAALVERMLETLAF